MLNKGRTNSKNFVKRTNNNSYNNVHTTQNTTSQIYMGDLDPQWDEDDVRAIWSQLIQDNFKVKMINKANMNPGTKNIGYCFIEFHSNLNAAKAISKNGTMVPGYPQRRFKLNWSNMGNSENRHHLNNNNSNLSNIDNCHNKQLSIFVGDLAPNVTNTQLYALFKERYPSTEFANVKMDPRTQVSKGYGFVKFNNPIEQQRAILEMQNVKLNGRNIKIGSTTKSNNNSTYHSQANILSSNNRDTKFTNTLSGNNNKRKIIGTNLWQSTDLIPAVQKSPQFNPFNNIRNTTVKITIAPITRNVLTKKNFDKNFQSMGKIKDIVILDNKQDDGTFNVKIQFYHRHSAIQTMRSLQNYNILSLGKIIKIQWGEPIHDIYLSQKHFYPDIENGNNSETLSVAGLFQSDNVGMESDVHVLV